MTTIGLVMLVLGLVLVLVNLSTTHVKYIPGVGTVEVSGVPSAGAIILIVSGLLLAVIGFARRLLAAAEKR